MSKRRKPKGEELPPTYRMVRLAWMPRSKLQWAMFTLARVTGADLWNAMVALHRRIRRLGWDWPSRSRWEKWAKGRFPTLSAQCAQQMIKKFMDCLSSTTALRKAQAERGEEVTASYPWRPKRYKEIVYTNQDATIRDGFLRLGNGKGNRPLRIRLHKEFVAPGRLMEVQLGVGDVRMIFEITLEKPGEHAAETKPIGNDLGVNSIIAATDGETAIVVSGREIKAITQWRNKEIAHLDSMISRCEKGSKRRKRLVRAKGRLRASCKRKIRDILHKSTAAVRKQFPGAKAYVGEPFNDAAQKRGPVQAQLISQHCGRVLIEQLDYKQNGATEVCEAKSSKTCPGCGWLNSCDRVYRCKNPDCGLVAPRDVIGATNILSIGLYSEMRKHQSVAKKVVFIRPLKKYPGRAQAPPGSSGGTPAKLLVGEGHNACT